MKRSYVVIPVRELENTKLRLADELKPEERASLTSALLTHIIRRIEKSKIDKAIIVASSPESISTLLSKFRKVRVIKESNHNGGVSSAMEDGLNAIGEKEGLVILLPSDLPYVATYALNRILSLLQEYDLLINPSRRLDGTSVLAFNLKRGRIPLHYDDDSFERHLFEAKRLKKKYRVLLTREFSFDVDSSEDLRALMHLLRANSFGELLNNIGRVGLSA